MNVQLNLIYFGLNREDNSACLRQVLGRPRSVARLRADDMLNRLSSSDARVPASADVDRKLGGEVFLLNPDQSADVYVSYGRQPNVIGNLRCSTTTSLAEMRVLISKHLPIVDQSYRMIALDGTRAFPRHEEDKRHVLLDCGHNLQLRPSTWLTLSQE